MSFDPLVAHVQRKFIPSALYEELYDVCRKMNLSAEEEELIAMERVSFGPFDGGKDPSGRLCFRTQGYEEYLRSRQREPVSRWWDRETTLIGIPYRARAVSYGSINEYRFFAIYDRARPAGKTCLTACFYAPRSNVGEIPEQRPKEGIVIPCQILIFFLPDMFRPLVNAMWTLAPQPGEHVAENCPLGRIGGAHSLGI